MDRAWKRAGCSRIVHKMRLRNITSKTDHIFEHEKRPVMAPGSGTDNRPGKRGREEALVYFVLGSEIGLISI